MRKKRKLEKRRRMKKKLSKMDIIPSPFENNKTANYDNGNVTLLSLSKK
jgi:hypothetical protein